jgi:CRISPR-associated protein (TIGR02584 family)
MTREQKLQGRATEKQKQILLCVAGGTPAIITETLWALKERGERVDEIRVITTKEGRETILKGRVNRADGTRLADESLLDKDHGQFYRFLRDFPEVGKIKFDEHKIYVLNNRLEGRPSEFDLNFDWDEDPLIDILDDEDSKKVGNQICEIVWKIAADKNVRLHASIAGGRKTMGLYLLAAMQLFGRRDDAVSHVLVSKEVESGAPKFFYKPPRPEPILDSKGNPKTGDDGSVITTDDVEIYLANIQFIRLHGVGSEMLSQQFVSYESLVQRAQENLERFNLKIDLKSNEIKVGERLVNLGNGGDFFVYVMFAYLRREGRGQEGYLRVDEISLQDFDAVCRLISKARGSECGYRDFIILREDALESLNYRFYKERNPGTSDSDALSFVKKTISDSISAIRGGIKKAGVSQDFAICNLNKNTRKEPAYGLAKIEPNRISIE